MSRHYKFTKLTPSEKESDIECSETSDDGDCYSAESSLEIRESRNWRQRARNTLPWPVAAVSIFANIILLVALFITRPGDHNTSELGTFETGFKSDFADARKHIEVVETIFNGAAEFKDDGTMYIPNPDPIRYVGDPRKHPEIDRNWEDLVFGRYFRITEEEAYESFGDSYRDYWDDEFGAYLTGIDMFHTLHCINHLRRAYYPDIYDEGYKAPEKALMHRDHCLEQLRQYVMCHGDMTPIPTKYFKWLDRNYVLSDMPHVCRNFDKLQSWMLDRYHGPHSVHRYNRTSYSV